MTLTKILKLFGTHLQKSVNSCLIGLGEGQGSKANSTCLTHSIYSIIESYYYCDSKYLLSPPPPILNYLPPLPANALPSIFRIQKSGWEIGSCGHDGLANTKDETEVNVEGDGERYTF